MIPYKGYSHYAYVRNVTKRVCNERCFPLGNIISIFKCVKGLRLPRFPSRIKISEKAGFKYNYIKLQKDPKSESVRNFRSFMLVYKYTNSYVNILML